MTMRRRDFITLLGGATVSWPLAARAQDGRTYHIAVLNINPRGSPVVTALFDELRRNGLVEGRNLVVEGSGIGIPYPSRCARFGFPVKGQMAQVRSPAQATRVLLLSSMTRPPCRSSVPASPGF
jgi:hypothetical protein